MGTISPAPATGPFAKGPRIQNAVDDRHLPGRVTSGARVWRMI